MINSCGAGGGYCCELVALLVPVLLGFAEEPVVVGLEVAALSAARPVATLVGLLVVG